MLYGYSNRHLLCWLSDMMEMVVVGPGQAQHWSKFWMLAPKLEIKVLWFSSVLRSSSVAAASVVVMFTKQKKKKNVGISGLKIWHSFSTVDENNSKKSQKRETFDFEFVNWAVYF